MQINKPMLIVDEQRSRANIQQMVEKAKINKLRFQPHFKTHQSRLIGSWFKEKGVNAITVSSVTMAKYFAEDGWQDITIAFPCNVHEIEDIDKLAGACDITVLIDNEDVIDELEKKLNNHLYVYIEIDTGDGRSGVPTDDKTKIFELVKRIVTSDKLNLRGCYSHAGHTYSARSKDEVTKIGNKSLQRFLEVKNFLESEIGKISFCFGDTPSCSVLETFDGIDAISPGNFVFYDAMQIEIGSCDPKNVAVAVACPVVSRKEAKNEVCIYGGAVHFGKDFLEINGVKMFGLLLDENWNILEGNYIKSLSQEHGILKVNDQIFNELQIGDKVSIMPIHCCLTAESLGGYISSEGNTIDHLRKLRY